MSSSYSIQDQVWVKVSGYPWWPALVWDPANVAKRKDIPKPLNDSELLVHFFGESSFALVTDIDEELRPWKGHKDEKSMRQGRGAELKKAIANADGYERKEWDYDNISSAEEDESGDEVTSDDDTPAPSSGSDSSSGGSTADEAPLRNHKPSNKADSKKSKADGLSSEKKMTMKKKKKAPRSSATVAADRKLAMKRSADKITASSALPSHPEKVLKKRRVVPAEDPEDLDLVSPSKRKSAKSSLTGSSAKANPKYVAMIAQIEARREAIRQGAPKTVITPGQRVLPNVPAKTMLGNSSTTEATNERQRASKAASKKALEDSLQSALLSPAAPAPVNTKVVQGSGSELLAMSHEYRMKQKRQAAAQSTAPCAKCGRVGKHSLADCQSKSMENPPIRPSGALPKSVTKVETKQDGEDGEVEFSAVAPRVPSSPITKPLVEPLSSSSSSLQPAAVGYKNLLLTLEDLCDSGVTSVSKTHPLYVRWTACQGDFDAPCDDAETHLRSKERKAQFAQLSSS